MRRCHPLFFAIVAVSWAVRPAVAQPAPPRPYEPVAVTLPAALDDASFTVFRTALAAAAKSRLYAELAPLVTAHGFFWGRDFGQRFDPHKPAVDNLATAIALESRGGAGWDTLTAFAAEASAEPLDSRPGVVCAPARPSFDGVAFSRLLDRTATSPIDWAYTRAEQTAARAAPQTGAAATGSLGRQFVRLLGFERGDGEPAPGRTQWARVALPDGKTGFVPPGSLMSLTAERLCYSKDAVGGWRIAGYIAGGI
jgi:hypothetical protein